MKKIGIVTPANLKYTPYINNYIRILEEQGIDYEILSWDRIGLDENCNFRFKFKTNDYNRKRVFVGYVIFAAKCKRYIKKNKIDKLIILTYAPAFFLGIHFLKHNKYIIDVRDDSPLIKSFPKIFNEITNNAEEIVVSSPKFAEWMPKKSILCHNADLELLEKYYNTRTYFNNKFPISIVYAGTMIENKINIEIIDLLKNDGRFHFLFIGRNNPKKIEIEEFVKNNEINNVSFEGTYAKEDIIDIYRKNASLINIFRENTIVNKNALPNKLYEAVIAGIPLAVFDHNEAISRYAKDYNLGVVLPEENKIIGEQIIEYMNIFNESEYENGRIEFLNKVKKDMETFKEQLLHFVMS